MTAADTVTSSHSWKSLPAHAATARVFGTPDDLGLLLLQMSVGLLLPPLCELLLLPPLLSLKLADSLLATLLLTTEGAVCGLHVRL
jgi:hypothetical protein